MNNQIDHQLFHAMKMVDEGQAKIEDFSYLSTSEWLALAIGVDDYEALDRTMARAWARLDETQQRTIRQYQRILW